MLSVTTQSDQLQVASTTVTLLVMAVVAVSVAVYTADHEVDPLTGMASDAADAVASVLVGDMDEWQQLYRRYPIAWQWRDP